MNQEEYATYHNTKHSGSDKYNMVNTGELIKAIQSVNPNYVVSEYREVKTHGKNRHGQQKHLVRLYDPSTPGACSDIRSEIVIINSYDRSSPLRICLGFFRFVCENGLIVGDTVSSFTQRHMHFNYDELRKYVETLPKKIMNARLLINKFKDKSITESFKIYLSHKTMDIRSPFIIQKDWDDERIKQAKDIRRDIIQYLTCPQRKEDSGKNVWSLLNIIQENSLKGFSANGYSRQRPVTNIEKTVKINCMLWDKCERFTQHDFTGVIE